MSLRIELNDSHCSECSACSGGGCGRAANEEDVSDVVELGVDAPLALPPPPPRPSVESRPPPRSTIALSSAILEFTQLICSAAPGAMYESTMCASRRWRRAPSASFANLVASR